MYPIVNLPAPSMAFPAARPEIRVIVEPINPPALRCRFRAIAYEIKQPDRYPLESEKATPLCATSGITEIDALSDLAYIAGEQCERGGIFVEAVREIEMARNEALALEERELFFHEIDCDPFAEWDQ